MAKLVGTANNDSLVGGDGNDTIIGGAGNDTVDGGSGYNTFVVTGSADAFTWTVNAAGAVILTDTVVDAADPVDGSNEGVDTLHNIQAIQYTLPDGTVESTFQLDDYGNAPDAGNTQIQYGVWVNGRANFFGDLDYFKLDTVAGQKVVLTGGSGSTTGWLLSTGSQYLLQGQDSFTYPNSAQNLTWNSTGTLDVHWNSNELSSATPMASRGYSFILRRQLDGTDGNDTLVAGNSFEQLVGGAGDDTLTGSDRSDRLDGGAGNDVLTGGAGNDELVGGAGTSNVAVFAGNRADYSVTWFDGSNLNMRIEDRVAGRDGIDTLQGVQILRFADGDVVLDAESNTPTSVGAVAIGQAMSGSLPIGRAWQWLDVDYFQQKFTSDISTTTVLRITVAAPAGASFASEFLSFRFLGAGSGEVLTFRDLNSSPINLFETYVSPGSQQSWFVSPSSWGGSTDFLATAQRADVQVRGFAYGGSGTLGETASYTITVDRVLYGTTGGDLINGDPKVTYIDAREGNDTVVGSDASEQIIGGAGNDSLSGGGGDDSLSGDAGNDTLSGGAGNDTLNDAQGVNSLSGGDGDDLIDVSAATAPTAVVDGGAGIDTLKIQADTVWSGLTVSNVEVLDGSGGRTALTPQQVAALGFTTAQNIVFRLDPSLASGGTLDASGLAGNLSLRGTNQSDTLIGNAGDNTIRLRSDETLGAGLAIDTVQAGAGNDTIVWSTMAFQPWSKFFSSADATTRTYAIQGNFDGGDGNDRLVLNFGHFNAFETGGNNDYWLHLWGDTWNQATSPPWKVDLSGLAISSIERLDVLGYDANRFWAYPSGFILTASQLAALNTTSGLGAVSVVGGGAVDFGHLAAIGITNWRLGDAQAYQVTGTSGDDVLSVGDGATLADLGDGDDQFIIEGKPLVSDTLIGGAGTDTLTIRGGDVDLSGAQLSGIEAVQVSSTSLSMTSAQWASLGAQVSRVAGASTAYLLSITEPGTTSLAADSPYVGLTGSSGDDQLIGNAGNNVLVGGDGNDSLIGNAGDDSLTGGAGNDTVLGGAGNDVLVGGGGNDLLIGDAGNDSLVGDAGNDTIIGGAGNDTVDGGSGYNTFVVTGSADAFTWTVNAAGAVILTDTVVDAADPVDGSNEGVDTLRNIQAIQYTLPDGTVESTFQLDDYGNAPDAGNTQIQYGVWVNGRANFFGDLDYFKLDTVAGQKVVLTGGSGSTSGWLGSTGSSTALQGQNSYTYSGSAQNLTWNSTGTLDVYWNSNELSSATPMASRGYSFILRRQLDGTDGNDTLVAGNNFEQLVGGAGDDTLTGSDRSDRLDGGDGNDVLTGGAGNDELVGGAGTSNVAVFAGNRADYSVTWFDGSNLNMRIEDRVAGRDGVDTLQGVQILRFADGDVVLDAESNTPTSVGAVAIGQAMSGSLPIGRAWQWLDVDYFQQKFTSDISTTTVLRITAAAPAGASFASEFLSFRFLGAGSGEVLTFKDLNSNPINLFETYVSPGSQRSWFVSPSSWGGNTDFLAIAQRADVQVNGFAYGGSGTLGETAGYTITVDRVLYGTTGGDLINGDPKVTYIDAREGNDTVVGSDASEQIIGGAGNDTLSGGAGNDTLNDAQGVNSLSGGDGDDLIDVSAATAPTAVVDGGAGIDTLKIQADTVWSGLTVSNVEVLDGSGGRTALTPQQVAALGFTTAQNIVFRLDPSLASGGTLDASGLAGNLSLRGTNQSDTLIGNAGDNTIRLRSDETLGAGLAIDTVQAGAGNDTIVWSTMAFQPWSKFFSSVDAATRTYAIQGNFDGGDGNDRLVLNFGHFNAFETGGNNDYWLHLWGDTRDQATSPPWKVDLSGLAISSIERLDVLGYDANRFWAYPSGFILTASQLAALNTTSGLGAVSVVGGGAVDFGHLAAIGITNWRLGDAQAYQVTGTSGDDVLSVGDGATLADLGDGDDQFIIEGKPLVSDTLIGGAGTDTLTIRGGDVDLSGAQLSGIEAVQVSSTSLSMTSAQWASLGAKVSRVAGASTAYILSITEPGTTSLAADSPYVGLTGSSGDDQLIGNAGNNVLVGGAGNDTILGGAGNDRLVTGAGLDSLTGGDGDDTLVVTGKTSSRDSYDGGAGSDTLQVTGAVDLTAATITGVEVLSGSGTVTLSAAQLAASFAEVRGVTVQLAGTATDVDLAHTRLGADATVLLPAADSTVSVVPGVIGTKGDDSIVGSPYGDVIFGGRGADGIDGGAGDDTLIGGSGVDTLIGGAGNDVFRVERSEFAASTGTVYSDVIDGGAGNDTLEINFGSRGSEQFSIAKGAVTGVESLRILDVYWSNLQLDASTFRQFSEIEIDSREAYPGGWLKLSIDGDGGDIDLNTITSGSEIDTIRLNGRFADIEADQLTLAENYINQLTDIYNNYIGVSAFDSITLGAGNNRLNVYGDSQFTANAGAGDDLIRIFSVQDLRATIAGGSGNDTLDLTQNGFVDISHASLTSIENVQYGSATLVVSQAQLDGLSFVGSGVKFLRQGDLVVGSAAADSYTGDGSGSFQGGGGNDQIRYVDTAVFTGNYADYDFVRNGSDLVIQQARGSLADGTDTLNGVLKAQFADTTVVLDDAPNSLWAPYALSDLTHAEYDKRVSARKDYGSDTDLFSATLVPNSPIAIEASSEKGSGCGITFRDLATGQDLQFKSLVYGWVYYQVYSWMSPDAKWLPGFQTSDGFKPYQGGEVVLQYNLDGTNVQNYAFTLKYLDDYAGSVDTLGQMDPLVGEVRGYVGDIGDADWIRTTLIAGTKYEFNLKGAASASGTLIDPKFELLDAQGNRVESGLDLQATAVGGDDLLVFRPTTSGTYYLTVTDVGQIATGSWTLTQQSLDTVAGNVSTTERLDWSASQQVSVVSEINALSDHDWFRVWLDRGMTYDFRALGSSGGGGTLTDPQLSLRSVSGILLAQDDNSGGGSDAKLIFRPTDSGWYFLDAGAAGNAGKGTYKLSGSTLADDFGNSVQTNGMVQLGTPVHGLISYNGDTDWFKTGLTKGQMYVIDAIGDKSADAKLDPLVDPMIVIHDASGKAVFKADDFGNSLDARAYFTPTADGLYFIEVKSAFRYDTGAYQVSVGNAPADDFVDSVAPAVANPNRTGALTLGTPLAGTIGVPGDHDMFRVDLQVGRVYQLGAQGLGSHNGTLADPYLRVFDAKGHLLDFANDGGAGADAMLYFAPTATGTYYLEASANADRGMGSYQVSAVQRDLPPDDVPNDLSTQVTLSPGDSFAGQLLTHNDVDWFRIQLTEQQAYVFRVRASESGHGSLIDPVLEIHAADGTLIQTIDNGLISHEPAVAFTPVATGTYYLVVRAADGQTDTGSYTLVTRAPDDHSDTKVGATPIAQDASIAGAIQWNDGAYGVRVHDSIGIATDADEDWFKFGASAGEVLSVAATPASGSTLSRLLVEVVDANGRMLAIGDGLETNNGAATASFKVDQAGTYFARVIDGAGATGAYSVRLSSGDASDEDATGPLGLDFATAGAVTQAQAVAKIGLAGDVDHFTVDLQGGHQYRFETLAVRDGTVAPITAAQMGLSFTPTGGVAIGVAAGQAVAQPSLFDVATFTATSDGRMAIDVSAIDATQTGQYKLRVVDLGGAVVDDRPDQVAAYHDNTDGLLAINESAQGQISGATDTDLFAINLSKGNLYDFSVKGFGDGLGTLAQPSLRLLDANGALVTSGRFDAETGRADLAVSVFDDGRYYLAVAASDSTGNVGTYQLDTRLRDTTTAGPDDIGADTRSGVSVRPGAPVQGTINYAGDSDWIGASLEAGKVYVLDVLAKGYGISGGVGGTLTDSTVRLLDANGVELMRDDNSGAGSDSRLVFSAVSTGQYFVDVGGQGSEVGTYTLRLRELYSGVADPLESAQWYLPALGVDRLNGQASGAGVLIGMVDDGIDTSHPDLQGRIDFSLAYDAEFKTTDGSHKYPPLVGVPPDRHGTSVAGLMVAEQNNQTGIVGVAPDAQVVPTRIRWTWSQTIDALGHQYEFDVSNNSWCATSPFSDNFNSTAFTFGYEALRKGVEDGREGLGTVFVFSAGNSAGAGDNTNYHNFQNAREVITVAAANPDGTVAFFSTPGASILIGTYGVGLLTTDRHQTGLGYEPSSAYTIMNGTSASAPVVSGVAALMLEANPLLGYRDVQNILALSATHPDSMQWKSNGATNWNLGGMLYNDQLGFGLVDAYAAVQLAATWTHSRTSINEAVASARQFNLQAAIPDGQDAYTKTFHIDSTMLVEHVELSIDLRHTRLGDIVIELTSPDGTVSRLMDRPTVNAEMPFGLSGTDSGVPTHLVWDFSSVQFLGEQATGDWTVSVCDVRAEEAGTLSSLSLRVYGARDDGNDTYVFTEEGFRSAASSALQDETGNDTINASAMLHDTFIDLAGGVIAAEGVTDHIASWTVIENAISGAGSDRLVGNDAANMLEGRDGNDTLEGGLGDDTLVGGAGSDTAVYAGAMSEFGISYDPNTQQLRVVDNQTSNGNEGTDLLTGIERIVFSDGEMSLSSRVGNHAPVANRSLFDTQINVGKGMAIAFELPAAAFSDADQASPPSGSSNGSESNHHAGLTLKASSESGDELPSWLSFDPETGRFSGVPPEGEVGRIKVKVDALDDFGESASGVLTFQLGDNQAPTTDASRELVINEDAPLFNLGISVPVDPEGTAVSVTINDVPTQGQVYKADGSVVLIGAVMAASDLQELHYKTGADANGNAGNLHFTAKDADGVTAESSIHIFVAPVNDAPRFGPDGTLTILYPTQRDVVLDIASPTDPESPINQVTVVELPALGHVRLNGSDLSVGRVLTVSQLKDLHFALDENVNGPIGGLGLQAVDPQGLATTWKLSLQVQGEAYSNVGTAIADAMYGSIGDDLLYGLGGDDTLAGNAGSDRLFGGAGDDTLLGGSGNDVLDGSSGNDWLDGGTGNDTMGGGPGNDHYVVDSSNDVVVEALARGAGGIDSVDTAVSYTLPANVENLTAQAGLPINLTGNELNNQLSGNDSVNIILGGAGADTLIGFGANDTLDGGLGVDKMAGGAGDDLYKVDSRSDLVLEYAGEGTDTVQASCSYTLTANVENLTLLEGGDYSGGGNSLANVIVGNSANNVLSGGLGTDTLIGGLGDDTYVINDLLDTIIDSGGIDTIRTSVSITLQDGIERAELIGLGDISAMGNAADNTLIGNAGSNTLDGGAGIDILTGGAGGDGFMLVSNGVGKAPDTITDFKSGDDLIMVDLRSFGIDPVTHGVAMSGTVSAASFVQGAGAKALDPNDYFVYDTAQHILYVDPDGSGSQAAIQVAYLPGAGATNLVPDDLYVFP